MRLIHWSIDYCISVTGCLTYQDKCFPRAGWSSQAVEPFEEQSSTESALQWMCVRVCVCVCTTDTAAQILLLLLLLLPLSYIAPPSQLFQEELVWRNTSRKRNSSLQTHDQINSFMHHSMCSCLIYSTNPLPILGLEKYPTGVVTSDWCSPPGYLWRSFPKTALSNLFPCSTYCRLQEEVI